MSLTGVLSIGSLALTYFLARNVQYHGREGVSRSCSGREGVVPPCYGHQTKLMAASVLQVLAAINGRSDVSRAQ